MKYDLVVFDWDGTLMDSTAVIAACLQSACRDVGLAPPSDRDAHFVFGLGLADTFAHVAPDLDEEGRRRLSDRWRHYFLDREDRMPLYEGVREMLAELRGRGMKLAVATGKARHGLDRVLELTGLRGTFEATRCADEGFTKPHPGMLLALLEMTGVDPARAVMVGDTTHDLDLATNAGVDAVAVSYGAHDAQLLASRPAKARFATVHDLHRWLASPA